uniref:Zinc-ribbon domain-containing protein n=1 Tax=Thermofilum adornatum TaxID=1365176 RepID=A0A7C1CDX1_9CREN
MHLEAWVCPNCGTKNEPFSRFCRNCGAERPGLWRCSKGHLNVPFAEFCTQCGEPRAKQPPPLPPLDIARLEELFVCKSVDVELPVVIPVERPSSPLLIHGYECRSLLNLTEISATLLCVDENAANHVLKIPARYYLQRRSGGRDIRKTTFGNFGREVEVLRDVASLKHCSIVKFEEAFEAQGDSPPTLVFEYCEGGSLEDVLKEYAREGKKLGPVTAARIIVQVAAALKKIHELGYAHGDVKPGNILFSRDCIPKLADFNSARAIAVVSHSRVPLTYGYASPEHVRGGRPSQKGDVWSLALTLYEAATGENLFPLAETEYIEAIAGLEDGEKPEIETGDSDLDEIVERCLKVRPEERPSMEQFEEMLIKYLLKKLGMER